MKQVLLLFLFSTLSFSQTIVVRDDILINTCVSTENERLFLFYPDKLVEVNLNDLSTKDVFYDFSNINFKDFITISVNFKCYFLDPQGGGIYLFENYKLK
jgi:hypothetical protein